MKENLPVLLLRKIVLLPCQEVRLEFNNELSKKLVDLAIEKFGNKFLVICPSNYLETSPTEKDLPKVGVIAKIKNKIELPNGNYRIMLSGLNRVSIYSYSNYSEDDNILISLVKRIYIDNGDEATEGAMIRTLKSLIQEYIEINPSASNSIISAIDSINDLDMLTDVIANFLPLDINKKHDYMNEFDYLTRAQNLVKEITVEKEMLSLEGKIEEELKDSFDEEQKRYMIEQKINKFYEELGISVDKQTEVHDYNEKINSLDIDEKIKNRLLNEVKKYSYTSETNPDSSVTRNYIDTLLELPWNIVSEDETDLKKIKKNLDKRHYGLEEVKNRILEYIAIQKNTDKVNAPILCLVGPPGTGKTTLGYSISRVLNREFYKISVGGLNDPTELTGHKRTYLGSSPGRIIQGLKKCHTKNPVFLIDEVDKMVSDYKGDPSAVLLDILDSNQNKEFVDNYVEEPFDLSQILFILTANDINSISSPLRDRLEIIEISSYTEYEKIDIAKKHLIPAIMEEYNYTKRITFKDEAILKIINSYTKESGVRELERILKKIFRYILISEKEYKTISEDKVKEILGLEKYNTDDITSNVNPGSVSLLGVTPYGGMIINVESVLLSGSGNVNITGNIEESIKESVNIAYTYVKANAKTFGIDVKKVNNNDVFINALKYHIKKDGTSGGVGFVTSLISLFLGKAIDNKIGFTGEVTLHGDVLKVGGIKEKLIGAYNNGFKKVFIPKINENDLENIPNDIKKDLEIICVSNYIEIFNIIFSK